MKQQKNQYSCFKDIILVILLVIIAAQAYLSHSTARICPETLQKLVSPVCNCSTVAPLVAVIPPSESKKIHDEISKVYAGVAVTTMLGSPKWFQNRYSMMVNNVNDVIPADWVIQIFHNNKRMALEGINYPGVQRLVERGRLVLTALPDEMNSKKKKEVVTSRWFWQHVLAERVLFFGGGSVFCANSKRSVTDYAPYDYIGSPWREFDGRGGDGAVSLRNRTQVLAVVEQQIAFEESRRKEAESGAMANVGVDKKKKGRGDGTGMSEREAALGLVSVNKEDSFVVKGLMQQKGRNIAPAAVTRQFVMSGQLDYDSPLAAHGTLPGLNDSSRTAFLEYCPEMKMFFPVLHASSCFGAEPAPAACFQTLCEAGGLKCRQSSKVAWVNDKGKRTSLVITVE